MKLSKKQKEALQAIKYEVKNHMFTNGYREENVESSGSPQHNFSELKWGNLVTDVHRSTGINFMNNIDRFVENHIPIKRQINGK